MKECRQQKYCYLCLTRWITWLQHWCVKMSVRLQQIIHQKLEIDQHSHVHTYICLVKPGKHPFGGWGCLLPVQLSPWSSCSIHFGSKISRPWNLAGSDKRWLQCRKCGRVGSVADWSASRTCKPAVLGSSPALTTTWICFLVEPSSNPQPRL